MDTGVIVLEDAVTEAVATDVGLVARRGQWRGRPETPGFLVTHVKRFAARIGHRVVVPWCQSKLVRVLGPRVGDAAFGNDRAKVRVGEHVDPGRRRGAA